MASNVQSDFRGDVPRIPSEHAHDLRDTLGLKHYELVSRIGSLLSQEQEGLVKELFERIAEHNLRRLALLLGDVFAQAENEHFQKDFGALQCLVKVLDEVNCRESVRAELRKLPTRDAHRARMVLFEVDSDESAALAAAAIVSLAGEGTLSTSELVRRVGYHGKQTDFHGNHLPLEERIPAIRAERFYLRSEPAALAPQYQQLVDEFYLSTQGLFSADRYGYSQVADALVLDGQTTPKGATGTNEQELLNSKRILSKVFVPWSDTPDFVHQMSFQSVDSASVARSFFVERGVPTEIYLVKVEGFFHNVAVAFFPDGEKFSPCVIDASPLRGFYELNGKDAPTGWTPQGMSAVRAVRHSGVSFAYGAFAWNGLMEPLPWCCRDTQCGRIVVSAGVYDEPTHPERAWIRGEFEYYDRGERERYPSVLLRVLGGGRGAVSMVFIRDASGETTLHTTGGEVTPELVEYGKELALEHLPLVEATIKRMEIPVGQVVW